MRPLKAVLRSAAYLFIKGLPRSTAALWRKRRSARAQQKPLHVIIMTGGLGDLIASEPAVRELKKPDEATLVLARLSYLTMFNFNPMVDHVIGVGSYVEAITITKLIKPDRLTNLHIDRHKCNDFPISIRNKNQFGINDSNYYESRSLCDVYSLIGLGHRSKTRPKLYSDPGFDPAIFLKAAGLSTDRPVFGLHTQAMEKSRSLPAPVCREIADWLLQNTDFNIIEFGLEPVLTSHHRVLKIGKQLSMPQQAAVMQHLVAFLGVDSGFSHMASASGTPCLMLLGAYHGFSDYLPWQLNAGDVVVRTIEPDIGNFSSTKIIGELSVFAAKIGGRTASTSNSKEAHLL